MATPPVTLKSSSSASLTPSPARQAFDLRSYAIHQVGHEHFKAFELWAFHSKDTVIYDDSIIWKWNNTHSKDIFSPGNTRDCLDSMIAIWKSRFAPEEEEEFPVKIDFKDSPRSELPSQDFSD